MKKNVRIKRKKGEIMFLKLKTVVPRHVKGQCYFCRMFLVERKKNKVI